jgi:hypothetical protein
MLEEGLGRCKEHVKGQHDEQHDLAMCQWCCPSLQHIIYVSDGIMPTMVSSFY